MILDARATFDYREVFRIITRRRLLILLPAVITIAAAAAGVQLMQPMFSSSATLAQESSVGLTRAVAAAAAPRGRDRDRARLMLRRITSSNFLESVAVQIGLHEDAGLVAYARARAKSNPGHDENDLLLRRCVDILRGMINVRSEGGSIFRISAVSPDPWQAHRVAAAVAEQYLQTTRTIQLQMSGEAHTFALEQMAIYEEKVEEKRREIGAYEQRVALRPLSSSPVSATNISRVNTLIAAANADLEFARGRHEIIRSQVAEANLTAFVDLGLVTSPKFEALRETLLELERHLALTTVEYRDGEPPVLSAKTQIAVKSQQLLVEAEALVEAAFPSVVEEYRQLIVDYEYTKINVEATERRRLQLEEFLGKYASDLTSMPAEEFQMSRLREELDSAENLYQTWLDQANSTQIAKAVQAADVGNPVILLEAPQVPLSPYAPDRNKILALAIGMGIVLGLAAAVVAEYFDLTLKSPDQIEAALGVPILGTVPRMQATVLAEMDLARRRRVRLLVASGILVGLGLAASSYWYFILQKGLAG
ncbi:MAG: hypothetical protein DHS20C21_04590 [Gemmatimonadota bacterium]|nr:MAG: hypothetical protein DHS20C21_04590 [Gemmatimonadota bacterium]